MRQAVAISTTGDEHRLGFLETAVKYWDAALNPGDSLFVTVDGDDAAAARVYEKVWDFCPVYQVEQTDMIEERSFDSNTVVYYGGVRRGVAANKNTGLELMMDNTKADHLFLCDDDTYPRDALALRKHTELAERIPHSMVCWGNHRLAHVRGRYASWTWPRGVLLYSTRRTVEKVGGMVEDFGIGGHEHAEWSRRIYQHGLTPTPFVSPMVYAMTGVPGPAARADHFWHCEDMRKPNETVVELGHRRKAITSVKRTGGWENAERIMRRQDGDTSYVPFRAHENSRASATLIPTSTGQGAGGEQ